VTLTLEQSARYGKLVEAIIAQAMSAMESGLSPDAAAKLVGYESDAAFSKAFKRVVGANPGEYLKRGFEGHGNAGTAGRFLKRRILTLAAGPRYHGSVLFH
jgi:AraC-like DNA-binding protein